MDSALNLVTWISERLSTTHRTPRDINIDLAQRMSSSLHLDSACAILRRVRFAVSRDAATTLGRRLVARPGTTSTLTPGLLPRGRLVLIIRTDVSTLFLFVPIWRSFFLKSQSVTFLIVYEKPKPISFCTWSLSCCISSFLPLHYPQCVLKTSPRVRPVCLQRDAGGLS